MLTRRVNRIDFFPIFALLKIVYDENHKDTIKESDAQR